jgi:hypothetical protein
LYASNFRCLNIVKVLSCTALPRLPTERCFLKVPRLRPFVLLVRVTVDEDELLGNDTDRGNLKYPDEDLSQCQFHHHKSHIDWSGIEPGTPQ